MKDKSELIISYFGVIWHYYFEDNLGFDFCAGIIKQNELIEITGEEVEAEFIKFFKQETGISPWVECPLCGGKTIPHKSVKGYFIGCSNYPKCDFWASKTRKFATKEKYLKMLQKESDVIEQAKVILTKEGENLYLWMQNNIKFLKSEKDLISPTLIHKYSEISSKDEYKIYRVTMSCSNSISYKQAKKVLTIYKKAKNLGYPEMKRPELYKDKFTDRKEYLEKQIDEYYNILKISNPQISRDEAKQQYSDLFRESYGISFDDLCPKCSGLLSLRKHTRYGFSGLRHYIGCINYPECDFFANSERKFLSAEERQQEQEIINKALSIPTNIWIDLCSWLESQRTVESKKKFPNWYIALNSVQDITRKINIGLSITKRNANRLIDILEKAISLGFECNNK